MTTAWSVFSKIQREKPVNKFRSRLKFFFDHNRNLDMNTRSALKKLQEGFNERLKLLNEEYLNKAEKKEISHMEDIIKILEGNGYKVQ